MIFSPIVGFLLFDFILSCVSKSLNNKARNFFSLFAYFLKKIKVREALDEIFCRHYCCVFLVFLPRLIAE